MLVACVSLDLSLAVRLIFACVSIASFALSLYSAAILLLLCYWPRDDGKANEKPRRYHRKTWKKLGRNLGAGENLGRNVGENRRKSTENPGRNLPKTIAR